MKIQNEGVLRNYRGEKFMKNLKWKKVGSAVLATALAGSMVLPATAYAQGEIVQLEGGTSTQTNTAPEQVFLNKYSGTVRTQNFNDNWKFYLGDASGAQTPAFDDSSWDQVNLPHDYSIDQKYSQKMEAESGYLPGRYRMVQKKLYCRREPER